VYVCVCSLCIEPLLSVEHADTYSLSRIRLLILAFQF